MKAYRACPKCGSETVRVSRRRGFTEKLRGFLGVQYSRCRDCGHRFTDHPWRLRYLIYARCPKCQSMVLRNWSEKYFYPPRYKRWLKYIGGREQRCEACRYNFVSFRKRWRENKNGSK